MWPLECPPGADLTGSQQRRMPKKNTSTYEVRKKEAKLREREARARRLEATQPRSNALFEIWEEATLRPALASKLWPAGRDAALLMLPLDRALALRRLIHVLTTLNRLSLDSTYVSCLVAAASQLDDHALLQVALETHPSLRLLEALPMEIRERFRQSIRSRAGSAEVAETAQLLGMLLEIDQPDQERFESPSKGQIARAAQLRYSRQHGAINAAGLAYQALYGLWRLLREPDIDQIGLEDLEDVTLRHSAADGSSMTEHVQAKTRDEDWSIPDLQSQRADGYKVFDSFAEVALADRSARFTFASNGGLTRGKAPQLENAVRKLSEIGPDPDLSQPETDALSQLQAHMNATLLAQIGERELLARVSFDAERTSDQIRADVILTISEEMNVTGRAARLTYYALVGLFQEAMSERKTFSREEIRHFMERATVQVNAFAGRRGMTGRVDILDFASLGTSTAERFYLGQSSSPADIASGWDVPRPDAMALIDDGLRERHGCLVRSPSGQGKTVLMYRYGFEARESMLVVRVLGGLDHATAGDVLEAADLLDSVAVLVIIDDIAQGDRFAWPDALRRLIDHPRIRVLATSREDDWNLAEVYTLGGLVAEVHPTLDQEAAAAIFRGLSEVPGVALHTDDWREPFEQSNGLLMEYIYLLTQGRRMADVVREQLAGLRTKLGTDAPTVMRALRYISTAHAYGGHLTAATIANLSGVDPDEVGHLLRVLQDEFWIQDSGTGHFTGVHAVRSTIVMNVMHEHLSTETTIDSILASAGPMEVGAMLEALFYQSDSGQDARLDTLVDQAIRSDASFALHSLRSLYAAEERRFADSVIAALRSQGVTVDQIAPFVLDLTPAPHARADLLGLLTEPGRSVAEALRAALPRRQWEMRADSRLLRGIGPEQLARWLTDEANADGITLLRTASLISPEIASEAVGSIGDEALASRVSAASPQIDRDLLCAVRDADATLACDVEHRVGDEHLINAALHLIEDCFAIQFDGQMIRGRFLASDGEGDRERALAITNELYQLFPCATESEVDGFLDVGLPLWTTQLRVPRENLVPWDWRLTANQFWLSLGAERLAGSSLVSVLEEQSNCGAQLLAAARDVHAALDTHSSATRDAGLARWEAAVTRATDVPYTPRTTPPVFRIVQEGGTIEYALPGSQPIDRAFRDIKTGASNAHRELTSYLAGRHYNRSILIHQLKELEVACETYRGLSLRFVEELSGQWTAELQDVARRLRSNLDMLTDNSLSHPNHRQTRQLFEEFIALRALTQDVIRHLAGDDLQPDQLLERAGDVESLRQGLMQMESSVHGWPDQTVLATIVDRLSALVSAHSDMPVQEVVAALQADLRRLGESTSLDLRSWLFHVAREEWIHSLESTVRDRLASRGVEAQCVVPRRGLDEFLLATVMVIARVARVQDFAELRSIAEDIAFTVMPRPVNHLILLGGRDASHVLPIGFERQRDPGIAPEGVAALNPILPWYPLLEIDEVASEDAVTVVRNQHPAGDMITVVRRSLRDLMLNFGHAMTVLSTAGEPSWIVDIRKADRPLARTLELLSSMVEQIKVVGDAIVNYPQWTAVAALAVSTATSYLEAVLNVLRGEPDPGDIPRIRQLVLDLDDAFNNVLYLEFTADQPPRSAVNALETRFLRASADVTAAVEASREELSSTG